MLWEEIEH